MDLHPATHAKDKAALGVVVAVGMTQTNNHKDTILIAYPPGAYGTFLEWCFNYFTGVLPAGEQSWPFVDRSGSAHRFRGNQIKRPSYTFQNAPELSGIDTYLNSEGVVQFARTHADEQDMQEYIDQYCSQLAHVVCIQPAETNFLLLINNAIDKIAGGSGIKNMLHTHVQEGMARWETREAISNFILGTRYFYSKYYSIDRNCVVLPLPNLISNLENALDQLFGQLGLSWSNEHRQHIGLVTAKWLSLQRHLNKDAVCQHIIESAVNGTEYDWADQNLSLYDEAFVQWALRDLHGLAMRCYNVDVFPTNTTDLRNLLINE